MRRAVLAILSTIVGLVLLLTFKTQTMTSAAVASPPAVIGSGNASSGTSSSGSSTSGSSTSGSSSSSSSSSSTSSKTVTGDSVDTRWGPVQVRVTIAGGKVIKVEAVDYPENNGRDQEINATAIPQLNSEATSAGSASIDAVSGATYTSEGYIGSLQSALDKAGL
jgi:uncharacterized protein with FMN-binding domain